MKRFLIVASVTLAAILLIALLLPFLINVDSFRPTIEQKLSSALGRTVHIGKLQASLFSEAPKPARFPSVMIRPLQRSLPAGLIVADCLQWMPLIFPGSLR